MINKTMLYEELSLNAHPTLHYKATNLYTKLGYKTLYSYWYRAKKEETL